MAVGDVTYVDAPSRTYPLGSVARFQYLLGPPYPGSAWQSMRRTGTVPFSPTPHFHTGTKWYRLEWASIAEPETPVTYTSSRNPVPTYGGRNYRVEALYENTAIYTAGLWAYRGQIATVNERLSMWDGSGRFNPFIYHIDRTIIFRIHGFASADGSLPPIQTFPESPVISGTTVGSTQLIAATYSNTPAQPQFRAVQGSVPSTSSLTATVERNFDAPTVNAPQELWYHGATQRVTSNQANSIYLPPGTGLIAMGNVKYRFLSATLDTVNIPAGDTVNRPGTYPVFNFRIDITVQTPAVKMILIEEDGTTLYHPPNNVPEGWYRYESLHRTQHGEPFDFGEFFHRVGTGPLPSTSLAHQQWFETWRKVG